MVRDSILSKDILFDTGVLKNIFQSKKPELEISFWSSIGKRNFYSKKTMFCMSTLTMCLECLGFKKEEFASHFQNSDLNNTLRDIFISGDFSKPDTIFVTALEAIKGSIKDSSIFKKEELIRRCNHELQFRSEFGKKFFEGMFQDNLVLGKFENSISQISFAVLQYFNYRKIGLSDTQIKTLERCQLSTFRQMLIDEFRGYTFSKPADSILVSIYQSKNMAMEDIYEEGREFLDTEIVDYVAIGSFQSGKHNAVAVFTTEKIGSWRKRIERYYSFLKYLLEDYRFTIYPGTIYYVNLQTGCIEDRLDLLECYREQLQEFQIGQDLFLKQ